MLTAEDREVLRTLGHKMRKKARRLARLERPYEEDAALRSWEQLFAYWLAVGTSSKPTQVQLLQKATELAHNEVSWGHVRYLRNRDDFKKLVTEFRAAGVEGALAKLKSDLPFYVETHRRGLEMALDDGNYNVIPKYTLHALEIVAPRRNDLGQQNVQVNITLSSEQQKLLETKPVETTWEVIKKEEAHGDAT